MAAIEALVLGVGAAAAFMAVTVVIAVIIGIQHEDRRGTVSHGGPPTLSARLARQVLGAHFCLLGDDLQAEQPGSGRAAADEAGALAGPGTLAGRR